METATERLARIESLIEILFDRLDNLVHNINAIDELIAKKGLAPHDHDIPREYPTDAD